MSRIANPRQRGGGGFFAHELATWLEKTKNHKEMKSISGILILTLIFSCNSNIRKSRQTDEGKSDKPGTYYSPDSVSKFMGASPDCIHEL